MNTLIKETQSEITNIPKAEMRETILNIEDTLKTVPGAMLGDCFPLTHSFADGCYIREIRVPKDSLLVTKIHKVTHPYFVLKGDVSVLTEEGAVRLKAPFSGITPAGTKRVCYIHEDTVWVTVHVTKETDLDKIEAEIIAKDYDDIDNNKIKEFIDTVIVNNEERKCLG